VSMTGVFGFDFLDSVEVSCCSDNFLCDQVNFGFGLRLPFATLKPIAFISLLNEKTRLPVSLLVTSFVAARFGCPPIEKSFGKALIERVACKDEIDREILQLLFEAGSLGLLPKDLAVKLERFKITRHQVSRRIQKMNKRLAKEFGEQIAEQRGWNWALTSFARDSWSKTEEE
jgi:hypothetical protein